MLTRDSIIWGLTIAGAVVAYLIGAGEPPTGWAYGEWLQALSFIIATISGKLATSPLPHSEEGAAKITSTGR